MFRRVLKENICLDKQNNPIIILDGFRGIIEFKAIHNIQMQSSKSNAFDCHIRGIIGDVRVDKISN
jgi:hypothetical protein